MSMATISPTTTSPSSLPTIETPPASLSEPENDAFWAQCKAHLLNVAVVVSFIAATVFFGVGMVSSAIHLCFGYSLAYLVGGFFTLAVFGSLVGFIKSYQMRADFLYDISDKLKVIENYTREQMLNLLSRNEIDSSRIPSHVDITARPFKILIAHYLFYKEVLQETQGCERTLRETARRDPSPLESYKARFSIQQLSWTVKIGAAKLLQRMQNPQQRLGRSFSILPMTFEEREASRVQFRDHSTSYIRFDQQGQPDITVSEMENLSISQLHQRLFQRVYTAPA